jgi:site-specific DNA-methyltransferase (adenine-specific)
MGSTRNTGTFWLHQGDALDFLTEVEDTSVDLLITDPPYASLEKHRAVGTTTRLSLSKASSNVWFPTIANDAFGPLFHQMHRILARDAHLYMFCDSETAFAIVPLATQAGFKFWKPLIWDKKTMGMGYHYRCRYEFILFFEKGKRKLNSLSIPDILPAKRIRQGYPTEKPVDLCETLVRQSSGPGDMVLDPFMGSGSAGVAATRLGRQFVGNDVGDAALALAAKNLRHTGSGEMDIRQRPLRRQTLLFGH